MTEEPDHPERFLPRIRQELDKLPLTEEQKAQAIPRLVDDMCFLDTRSGKSQGQLREDSSVFDFATKVGTVVERFAADGLATPDYLQAAVREPRLLYQKPGTIAANIAGAVERFAAEGLTTRDYLMAALKAPSLFCQSPGTSAANIAAVVERFAADGLTAECYLRAALKQPSLFTMSPATVAANIKVMVKQFAQHDLTTGDYLRGAEVATALRYVTRDSRCQHRRSG